VPPSVAQGPVAPRPLTETQRRALDALRRDGVVAIPFDELFGDAAFWAELQADMRTFVQAAERELGTLTPEDRKARYGSKSFLVRRFRSRKKGEQPALGPASPWVRLGISEQLLGIVNSYRGEPLRLHDVDNWYTLPEGEKPERVLSQKWHRDGWEDHIVKVFTYFSDVDEEAGPFEYLRGSPSGGKYGELWPWQEQEVYPDQAELEAAIDPADRVTLTGPPGTIVICDTSGFHRGGYARSKPRVLAYLTYLSDEGNRRHRRKFDVDWAGDGSSLSPAARYALE
jgi:hypothetical protein